MSDLLIRIMADYMVIAAVLVGGIGFLALVKKDKYQIYTRAIFMCLVALLLAKIASLFYQGQRPFELLGMAPKAAFLNNPGFPSDHALLVFAITFVVWASTKNIALSATLLVMSIVVAFGRVLALVHTPLDVLGSIACVVVAAVLVYGRKLYTFK